MTRHLLAVVRVAALLCLLQACAALFLVKRARANTERALDRVGSWLADLQGVVSNQPTALWLNNLHIWLASGRSVQSPARLLDEFEQYCNGKTGMSIPSELLQRMEGGSFSLGAPNRYGVFRVENHERGIVACLDARGATVDASTLTERAQAFLKDGDLAAFGELRYFLVFPARTGSTFLTAWTRGRTPLLSLFPEQGDAPGEDLPGIPRPADTQRQLSAGVPGKGRLTSYGTAHSLKVALERYQAQLLQAGWNVRKIDAPDSLLARLGERTVLVAGTATRQTNQSRITLAEL